jgi:hypothetical protein
VSEYSGIEPRTVATLALAAYLLSKKYRYIVHTGMKKIRYNIANGPGRKRHVEILTWFTPRIFGLGLFPVRIGCSRKCRSGRSTVDEDEEEGGGGVCEMGRMRRPLPTVW